jgi:hypothetical protein
VIILAVVVVVLLIGRVVIAGARYRYCPVGGHWSLVRPVPLDELTDEDRQSAEQYRDSGIP